MMDFETRAIHEGQAPDAATGAVMVPIYQTSTYVQEAVGEHKGYDYSRTANPTRRALEVCLASLESARYGFAFSSGMGATTTAMHLISPGDQVVAVNDVYGGTYRLFSKVYEPKGYRFAFAPHERPSLDAIDGETRLVWIETPTNPLLKHRRHRCRGPGRARRRRRGRRRQHVRDALSPATAGARRRHRRPLDHEVPRRPLRLDRRIRGQRTTPTVGERLAFLQNALGAVPGPFDCWLVLRGLKTLALRMQRHCENAGRSPSSSTGTRRSSGCTTPASRDTRGTTSPPSDVRLRRDVSFLAGSVDDAIALVARTRI